MTRSEGIPLTLEEQDVASAGPETLRAMVSMLAGAPAQASGTAACEAECCRSGPPVGSDLPLWLLERRGKAEQALLSVIATSYLHGSGTRKMDALARSLGVVQLTAAQVVAAAAHVDEQVEVFHTRTLAGGPYTFVWLDALPLKVRADVGVAAIRVLTATGVNADGRQEVLGLDVDGTEEGTGGAPFLCSLTARGMEGTEFVISDVHPGAPTAARSVRPDAASQRFRTRYTRALLGLVPVAEQDELAGLLRTAFEQPDGAAARKRAEYVVEALAERFPEASAHLEAALPTLLAFTRFPRELWPQIWSSYAQERVSKEVRTRTASSSPAARRYCGTSAPCSRSGTTSGRRPGDTWRPAFSRAPGACAFRERG